EATTSTSGIEFLKHLFQSLRLLVNTFVFAFNWMFSASSKKSKGASRRRHENAIPSEEWRGMTYGCAGKSSSICLRAQQGDRST
ncbi:MAG: hypothetical protein K2W95_10280, partial [Candidatus Obscuribacterales bacterium]|nr:hypothetical protein [Candidatus Obscuribacterales bacterium]